MRIGVLSDIHSNLEALNVCLKRLKQEGVERYIQCGDIIGYGPDSEKCVRRVVHLPLLASVMGNHDAVLAFRSLESLFNYDAKLALEKNLEQLSAASVEYLQTLPAKAQGDDFVVVHGTPLDPIKEYFHSKEQFNVYYRMWQGQICFVGHSHFPFYIKGSPRTCQMFLSTKPKHTISLNDKCRYVINPGAVGKPRDRNTWASFGLWDTQARTFTFYREPYKLAVTQAKMRAQQMPDFLIESLSYGL